MYTKDIFIVINILTILLLCFSAMFTFFINILLCMALFALLLAATISFGIFLKKSAEDTRYKKHVLISRVISIITAAAIIFPMVVCMGFNNKDCYGLKLFVFSCGEANIEQNRAKALPKNLPQNCDNYCFKLSHGLKKMNTSAASAVVKFSTDNDTLAAYEAEIIENGYKPVKPDVTFASFVREYELTKDDITVYLDNPSSLHYDYLYKKGVPCFVLEKIDDNIAGEFNRDFTVYDFSEKLGFHAGCMLDYTNGIVIFWA